MELGDHRGERKVEGESSLSGVSYKDTNPIRSARALPLLLHLTLIISLESFPGGSDHKESACNAGDRVWSLGLEDPLEKGVATHSGILACEIPWTEEPGGLWSLVLRRIGHNWATNTHTHISLEALSPYRYTGVRTPICEFRCMGEHRFSVCNR